MRRLRPFALAGLAALSACAHAPRAEPPLPVEQALNARGRLYLACTTAATEAGTVTRFGRFVRYRCAGEPARALFDEAAAFTRNRGHEQVEGVRTTRRFSAAAWDDACWREDERGGPVYGCFVDLGSAPGFFAGEDVPEKK